MIDTRKVDYTRRNTTIDTHDTAQFMTSVSRFDLRFPYDARFLKMISLHFRGLGEHLRRYSAQRRGRGGPGTDFH
jgi:hypothetical protein